MQERYIEEKRGSATMVLTGSWGYIDVLRQPTVEGCVDGVKIVVVLSRDPTVETVG